eukprot:12584196-Heterocapsa_arctica.AAC.1
MLRRLALSVRSPWLHHLPLRLSNASGGGLGLSSSTATSSGSRYFMRVVSAAASRGRGLMP